MNILITGAGSGIGRALAIAYAAEDVNLFLCGRNEEKLQQTKLLCQQLNAKRFLGSNAKNKPSLSSGGVFYKILDVRDEKACAAWITEIESQHALDLVIANAGISAGTAQGTESMAQIKEIFSTNIDGVINIIHPAIEKMKSRTKGQIAIISSLAGFRGLPSSPTYSASKAAVRVYAEGLRGNLAPLGISVSAVCPGYIKTPMTAVNSFPMPFLMEVDAAAQLIKRGLAQNKSRIAFPFPLYFVVWLAALLSTKITDPIFAKLPGKKSL